MARARVLLVGLEPDLVDYTKSPGPGPLRQHRCLPPVAKAGGGWIVIAKGVACGTEIGGWPRDETMEGSQ